MAPSAAPTPNRSLSLSASSSRARAAASCTFSELDFSSCTRRGMAPAATNLGLFSGWAERRATAHTARCCSAVDPQFRSLTRSLQEDMALVF